MIKYLPALTLHKLTLLCGTPDSEMKPRGCRRVAAAAPPQLN